jgi:hypothetical protein
VASDAWGKSRTYFVFSYYRAFVIQDRPRGKRLEPMAHGGFIQTDHENAKVRKHEEIEVPSSDVVSRRNLTVMVTGPDNSTDEMQTTSVVVTVRAECHCRLGRSLALPSISPRFSESRKSIYHS